MAFCCLRTWWCFLAPRWWRRKKRRATWMVAKLEWFVCVCVCVCVCDVTVHTQTQIVTIPCRWYHWYPLYSAFKRNVIFLSHPTERKNWFFTLLASTAEYCCNKNTWAVLKTNYMNRLSWWLLRIWASNTKQGDSLAPWWARENERLWARGGSSRQEA